MRAVEVFVWLLSLAVIATVAFATYVTIAGNSERAPGVVRLLNKAITANPFAPQRVFAQTGGKATILVLGTDATNNLCDTVMLVFVNENTKRLGIISLPRDARVHIPGNGWSKLAHVVPLGMEKFRSMNEAIALVRQTVEENFHIPIDYYVRVDVKGFEKLVDLIGGVKIYVEKNMVYRDREQGLYINLRQGEQVLNGYNAMCYVRFRADEQGDWGRMQRQQKFLRELAAQLGAKIRSGSLASPKKLYTLGKLVNIALGYCQTDLRPEQVVGLAKLARDFDRAGIETRRVPGHDAPREGIYYFHVDQQGLVEQVADLKATLAKKKQKELLAKVSVLNGCGVNGLAADVAEILKARGVRVAKVDNYSRQDLIQSEIRYAPGFAASARYIAQVLSPSPFQLVEDFSLDNEEHDVEVVLGRSYSAHELP